MNKEDYSTYLNHPLWQQKRNEVFSVIGRKCAECGSHENLEIHHKTYSPGKMPWEYPVENFIVFCEKCHANHHGFEYTHNKCKRCGMHISTKYQYCWPCCKNILKEIEAEKIKLEGRIHDLENLLKREQNNKSNSSQDEMKKHKAEKDILINGKNDIEKQILELKKLDDKFKYEIKEDIKILKSKIENLQKEKNNKIDDESLDKQKRVQEEIVRLKEEMDKLNEDLEVSKRIGEIKETFKINNQKIGSKINLLIIGLLFTAIILIVTFPSMNKEVPTNNNQTQLPKEKTTIDKKENFPVNDIINNHTKNEENKVSSRIDILESSVKNGQTNESNRKEKNDKVSFPRSTPQSNYKVISIDEVNSNLGNKIQIYEKISQVIKAKNGNVYLNIGGKYPKNKLSAVVFKNNVGNFEELKKYENKLVKIKGTLSNYRGRAQIIINHNWQMVMMK